MPLYGNFGEDHRDEHDRRPLRREDESPAAERAIPMPTYYRNYAPKNATAEDQLKRIADYLGRIVDHLDRAEKEKE